ncbi:SHC SH2 domain-binding protein 1 B [Chionoecetes opilio]|uniref:SHC SH2 domain-binding protein 1 B n=1 Tax=Chionoecetes opilio TaxID=41210 RepID=A0A8J4YIM8_CHIOP|nr:SHC SH2 domain-binding protein 1 B [Chionoecetes opilio]
MPYGGPLGAARRATNGGKAVCSTVGLKAGRQDSCEELPATRAESPCMPHVVRVQWEPDDHVAELSRMLQGVAPRHVERQLVQYVENKIEPAGWKAVWTIPQNLPDSVFTLKQETCVYVDVIDVSQEKLIAEVKVLRPVISDILKEDFQVIEEGKNNMVQVPLMQLSVLADQENEALDMVSTAEVICQIKFFYEHIWQPWDSEEENIRYDQSLITSRLKLYQDIQAARIPTAVGACLKAIIRDANSAEKKIQHIESKSEEKGMDYEMDQKDVAQLFKLHKQLEKLKSQFYMLKDPILREIAVHPSQEEETNIQGPHAKMKVVAHALTTVQMMKHMAMLSDLITSLPQVTDEDLWQTHTTLQNAINGAHEGDVIILLPGQHTLYQLGYLFAKCGALVGLGEGVVVEGNSENGDVLMDITGNFTIQNITLKPAPNQIGIVQHSGLTTLEKVTLTAEEFLLRADLETASNSSSSEDMETEDYYSSICDEEDDTGGHHRSTKFKAAHIVKVWLQAKWTDSLADPAFNSEKVLIDLFLRYNTAMPSSAAVERLFSLGKDINRAKRSSLSDENFNMLMFMKGNMLQNLV